MCNAYKDVHVKITYQLVSTGFSSKEIYSGQLPFEMETQSLIF